MSDLELDDSLRPLLAAPGARCAALMDPQGEVVAAAGELETLEALGAYHSVWVADLERASRAAGLGPCLDITFDFEFFRVLASPVKDGYFVLVILEKDGVAAIVRAALPRVRERLAVEVG